jgi:hypothetical protein
LSGFRICGTTELCLLSVGPTCHLLPLFINIIAPVLPPSGARKRLMPATSSSRAAPPRWACSFRPDAAVVVGRSSPDRLAADVRRTEGQGRRADTCPCWGSWSSEASPLSAHDGTPRSDYGFDPTGRPFAAQCTNETLTPLMPHESRCAGMTLCGGACLRRRRC